jgi:nucleotide-binding universal stress UspA family protein
MFNRVLVATDLTAATRASLRTALGLAIPGEGVVVLLHVIRPILGLPNREVRDFYEQLKTEAKRQMHALTQGFTRERGVNIACEIVVGQPAREIVRAAQKGNADVIVLAHTEGAAPLGSVSYKVVQLAKCAVLVLKTPRQAHVPASAGRQRAKRSPAA